MRNIRPSAQPSETLLGKREIYGCKETGMNFGKILDNNEYQLYNLLRHLSVNQAIRDIDMFI